MKAKLEQLKPGLPPGVEIIPVYDRSALIERAVDHLRGKLIEEFAVVALVCLVFLLHLRSALVAVVSLPLGVLAAFIVMRAQGVNANIMSLGGIAIAIGAMVDAAIVMIENAHKKLEAWKHAHATVVDGHEQLPEPNADERWKIITDASVEVGPALFFSLLVITLSFVPVFALEAQEGRLFAPLAYTKSYAMAAAAGLAVTLVPVLMGYVIRGRIPNENANPLNRWLIAGYRPLLAAALSWPKVDPRDRRGCARRDGVAGHASRWRVHAADGRGRSSLHANRAARTVRGQGGRASAANRPDDQGGARGRARVRQGRTRRNGDRPRADGDDRNDDPVQAPQRVARWE